jgi:hypothetical protein
MKTFAACALLLLGTAACTADPRTSATPMTPASPGNSAAAPQPPGSLPAGAVANAPRAPVTGDVNRTYVPGRSY